MVSQSISPMAFAHGGNITPKSVTNLPGSNKDIGLTHMSSHSIITNEGHTGPLTFADGSSQQNEDNQQAGPKLYNDGY